MIDKMIHLNEKHKNMVREIIKDFPYPIYVYGSRSKGTHRNNSDLDICVLDDRVTDSEIFNLQIAFEDSYLPFTVDVVGWKFLSDSFKSFIEKDLQLFE